jgi:hypothetical protein
VGIPALGTGVMDPAHVGRLSETRRLLDDVLDPGETYLDLTNRHAQYFYFDRRPPIESGAIYNLVAEGQQLRAIAALRRDRPPAVLVSSDNILHDGGPAGLRAPLVYRDALLAPGYAQVVTPRQLWLLRVDRLARLPADGKFRVLDVDGSPSGPLNAVLRPPPLRGIPAAWGRSANRLEAAMALVGGPAGARPSVVESAVPQGRGRYRVDGRAPAVVLDVAAWNVDGRDGGILSFEFDCERTGALPSMEIRWASAGQDCSEEASVQLEGHEGRLMVPLDASPAWLLARKIRVIRIGLVDGRACRTFRIDDVKLLQRHGAERGR